MIGLNDYYYSPLPNAHSHAHMQNAFAGGNCIFSISNANSIKSIDSKNYIIHLFTIFYKTFFFLFTFLSFCWFRIKSLFNWTFLDSGNNYDLFSIRFRITTVNYNKNNNSYDETKQKLKNPKIVKIFTLRVIVEKRQSHF